MLERGATNVILREGGRGVFQIRRDGRVLYDKAVTGRFPTPADLAALPCK